MADAWGVNTFPVRKYNSRTFHLKVRRSCLFRFFRRFPQINVGGDSVHFPPMEDAPVSPRVALPSKGRLRHFDLCFSSSLNTFSSTFSLVTTSCFLSFYFSTLSFSSFVSTNSSLFFSLLSFQSTILSLLIVITLNCSFGLPVCLLKKIHLHAHELFCKLSNLNFQF